MILRPLIVRTTNLKESDRLYDEYRSLGFQVYSRAGYLKVMPRWNAANLTMNK